MKLPNGWIKTKYGDYIKTDVGDVTSVWPKKWLAHRREGHGHYKYKEHSTLKAAIAWVERVEEERNEEA